MIVHGLGLCSSLQSVKQKHHLVKSANLCQSSPKLNFKLRHLANLASASKSTDCGYSIEIATGLLDFFGHLGASEQTVNTTLTCYHLIKF